MRIMSAVIRTSHFMYFDVRKNVLCRTVRCQVHKELGPALTTAAMTPPEKLSAAMEEGIEDPEAKAKEEEEAAKPPPAKKAGAWGGLPGSR